MRSPRPTARPQAHHPRTLSRRRGSALIIVIGTLALIAVFAAIYISIGQVDRRTAATVRIRKDQADFSAFYADHIAQIIADDRLDAVLQDIDANTNQRQRFVAPRRETTDAPYTDWSLRSEAPSNEPYRLFTPKGGNLFRWTGNDGFDPRVTSDPWLASTRPTYLGSMLGFTPRAFSGVDFYRTYQDNRDWLQISNLAPDGRFVNLFNLRNNFNAEPGWGTTNVGGQRPSRRMSEGLSLFKPLRGTENSPQIDSPIQAFDPVQTRQIWLPGTVVTPIPQAALSSDDIRNTPAVWTMYQRFSLIPLDQPFVTYNRNGDLSTWADQDFPAYQYADADGDGLADSRWFELTAARTRHTGNGPRTDIEKLYDAGDYRIFAAARVIDLSSLVNINTATDALTPPTEKNPLGLTPAEVDLRRLLTMQDVSVDAQGGIAQTATGFPLSFGNFHRPFNNEQTGQNPELWTESDVRRHRHDLLNTTNMVLDPDSVPLRLGRSTAAAIRRAIEQNSSLSAQHAGTAATNSEFHLPEGTAFLDQGGSATAFDTLAQRRSDSYFKVGSINPLTIGSGGTLALFGVGTGDEARFGAGLFGIEDLAELLTFHGINDPEVTSRLERVATGRILGPDGESRLSPLLTTRTLDLDRTRHGLIKDGVAGSNPNRPRIITGAIPDESMAIKALSPRSLLTTISGASPLRPFRIAGESDRGTAEMAVTALTQSDAAITMTDMASNATSAVGVYTNALAGELEAYRKKRRAGVNGINPAIINQIWQPDLTLATRPAYDTLFYGHRGPELALRIAAHAGLNAKDMFDDDDASNPDITPSVITLILDNALGDTPVVQQVIDAAQDADTFDLESDGAGLGVKYPGLAGSWTHADRLSSGQMRPDDEHVLPDNVLPPRRRAVNIYGVEPMPVITEVASMFVYTDAGGPGNDRDYGNRPNTDSVPVTIDGSIDPSNDDLLAQVLAIQVHNPSEVSITLGGSSGVGPNDIMWRVGEDENDPFDPQNNLSFDYYIEFNGRFYKMGRFLEYIPPANVPDGFDAAEIDRLQDRGFTGNLNPGIFNESSNLPEFQYQSVVLGAGETMVFYVMAHPRFDWTDTAGNGLDRRWTNTMEVYDRVGIPEQYQDVSLYDVDNDSIPDGFDGRGWTGPAQEWIERQLTVAESGGRAARMHEFDPRTGELVEQGVFTDIFDGGSPGSLLPGRTATTDSVRLWRKIVVNNSEEVPVSTRQPNQTGENLVQNDLLVDRIFVGDPGSNYLNAGLPESNIQITNTVGFREDYLVVEDPCNAGNALNVRNDNTGLSVVRWASARRKDRAGNLRPNQFPEPGAIFPWMIQSRRNPTSTVIRSTNKPGQAGSSAYSMPEAPDYSNFFELCSGGDPDSGLTAVQAFDNFDVRVFDIAYTTRELLDNAFAAQGRRRNFVGSITKEPYDKSAEVIRNAGDRFPVQSLGANSVGDDLYPTPITGLRPEILSSKTLDAPRIADVLLATGIGPTYAPDPDRPALDFEVVDDEWITLAEAYAIALGYETIPMADATAAGDSADAVWYDTVRVGPGSTKIYTLDELRLSLTEFVPYLNISPDPAGDTVLFDPGLDVRRGTGAPLALGVIDQLRPFDPIEMPGDANLTQAKRDLAYALNRPTMGLININTAPVEVLRLLPGLTPSAEVYRTLSSQSHPEWWGATNGLASSSELGLPTLPPVNPLSGSVTTDELRNNPDVATGLIAYRDRLNPAPRGRSRFPNFNFGFQPDFSDINNIEFFTQNLFVENDVTGVNPPRSRSTVTGIDGLRGAPGFASLGEMMAVTIEPTATWANADAYRNLTMTNLASDGRNLGVDGTGENTVSIDPKFSNRQSGVVIDDYAERLALLAGVANMTTVRSDYYAAWFVLQGYQNSDVAALRPEDPLVPSFKKRYLMVIDRSNVVEPGDAPRIVLFREVPL
jgi:hypothetical protein